MGFVGSRYRSLHLAPPLWGSMIPPPRIISPPDDPGLLFFVGCRICAAGSVGVGFAGVGNVDVGWGSIEAW
jgi:hypothetical protein